MDEEKEAYIPVAVDDIEYKVCKGANLGELLKKAGIPYVNQLIVAVLTSKEKEVKVIKSYKIKTSKGELIVRINDEVDPQIWMDVISNCEKSRVSWITPKAVAFGSFKTSLKAVDNFISYEKWDVGLSLAGKDSSHTHIIIAKKKHEASYIPPKQYPILGKVVAGRHVIDSLALNDVIEKVEPLPTREETVDSQLIERIPSTDWRILEPVKIYTHLKIKVYEEAASSIEHFYSTFQDEGILEVSDVASSYVCCEKNVVKLTQENTVRRALGTVTVRNTGEKNGAIFIYKRDRPPSNSHNVVGFVEKGFELLSVSKKGDKIMVKVEPKSADVLGLTQSEAEKKLLSLSLKQERCWDVDDKAVVVEQEPLLTVEAYKKKVVKTYGVNPKEIVKIRVYDEATRTAKYLRIASGLLYRKIGRLKVFFAMSGTEFILLRENPYPFQIFERIELEKLLLPEKTPKDFVDNFEVGVTNNVRKNVGLIGVRLKSSNQFGPTGEKFSGTNLVGRVVEGFEVLSKLKERDRVYFMEV
ncbi:MAG: methyl-coenzyme M reductase-associated protein Mmp3 [Candidatus Bathyarchaeota archaeon]